MKSMLFSDQALLGPWQRFFLRISGLDWKPLPLRNMILMTFYKAYGDDGPCSEADGQMPSDRAVNEGGSLLLQGSQ